MEALTDPEVKELSSTSSNDISETNSSSTSSQSTYSHIQKIPRPLIPEEDLKRPYFPMERKR